MAFSVNEYPDVPCVKYQDIRDQIQSGDILVCSGNVFVSKLIQHATQSVWSHIAFVIRLENINRIMVLESLETIGVRTVPLSNYVFNYNGSGEGYPGKILLARHQKFNNRDIAGLSKMAVDFLGYPYDTEELFKIAARIAMHQLNIPTSKDDFEPQKSFICSEYAYECFKSVGIDIPYNPSGYIAPADYARDPNIDAISFIECNANK